MQIGRVHSVTLIMASTISRHLSRLNISTADLQSSLHQQDSRTCSSCNDLFVNGASRTMILNGDSSFQYCREINDLEATAAAGCVLCQQLLDRHRELGPADVTDYNCPSDCPWSTFRPDNSQLLFLVQSIKDARYQDGGLRYLRVRGIRSAAESHTIRERSHFWELFYNIVTEDATLLKSLVPNRPPERNVASEGSYEQARKWIHECLDNHKHCQINNDAFLPSRVIDVDKAGVDPKLHVSAANESGPYIALSYCWGGPQTSQTTHANLEKYKSSMNFQSLPQTLKDAIVVTRELGYQYLWVDSICIVQDDEDDKLKELSQMRLIYQHASITISAASASACAQGFLKVRSHPRFRVKLYSSEPTYGFFTLRFAPSDGTFGLIRLTPSLIENLSIITDPITNRAWTLQESLLSSRLLIYSGTQLLWRCKTSFKKSGGLLPWAIYAERAPILTLSEPLPIDKGKEYGLSLTSATIKIWFGDDSYDINQEQPADYVDPGGIKLTQAAKEWLRIVSIYSWRQMAIPSDVFPAIGGIAEEIYRVTNWTYCAGLWLQSIIVGLAWRRHMGSEERPTKRARPWRAPSWSWASLDGPIEYDLTHHHWAFMKPMANVKDVAITRDPKTTRYGKLSGAWVTIEGSLVPVEIEPILEAVMTVSGAARKTAMQFADVYFGNLVYSTDLSGALYKGVSRLGTAILDESIEDVPFHWKPPAGGGQLYAFQLLGSGHWKGENPDRRLRFHGLLVTRLSDGTFMRVGWFNSFAMTREEAEKYYYPKEEWCVIKLV